MTALGGPPDLSICIVSWNTARVLRDCLASIRAHPPDAAVEIIVVDNASTDETAAMVGSEFPEVRLIVNSKNLGFARANNQAFALASGRYLLLLNSDTRVSPGALDRLVEFADAHPAIGALGCTLLNPDGTPQRSCWRGFPSLPSVAVEAFYLWRLAPRLGWVREREVTADPRDGAIEVDHLLGACMLVPRPLLSTVGGLNEGLFLFLEETDWCYRIKSVGRRIYFLPSVAIVHIGQQSVNQCPSATLPEHYRSLLWFCRTYTARSAAHQITLKLVIAAGSLLRVGLWTVRGWRNGERTHAQRMRAGYWQVVKQLRTL